jgi:hypothetical protein
MRLQLSNNEMYLTCTWSLELRDARFQATWLLIMTYSFMYLTASLRLTLCSVAIAVVCCATKKLGSWVIGQNEQSELGAQMGRCPAARTWADMRSAQNIPTQRIFSDNRRQEWTCMKAGLSKPSCTAASEKIG